MMQFTVTLDSGDRFEVTQEEHDKLLATIKNQGGSTSALLAKADVQVADGGAYVTVFLSHITLISPKHHEG